MALLGNDTKGTPKAKTSQSTAAFWLLITMARNLVSTTSWDAKCSLVQKQLHWLQLTSAILAVFVKRLTASRSRSSKSNRSSSGIRSCSNNYLPITA